MTEIAKKEQSKEPQSRHKLTNKSWELQVLKFKLFILNMEAGKTSAATFNGLTLNQLTFKMMLLNLLQLRVFMRLAEELLRSKLKSSMNLKIPPSTGLLLTKSKAIWFKESICGRACRAKKLKIHHLLLRVKRQRASKELLVPTSQNMSCTQSQNKL